MKKIPKGAEVPEIETLRHEVTLYKEAAQANGKEVDRLAQGNASQERRIEEQKEVISSLKSDLASAYENVAQLQGYLSRVHEDDSLREGSSREVVETRMHQEPLRRGPRPPMMYAASSIGRDLAEDRYSGALRSAPPTPKPWFER